MKKFLVVAAISTSLAGFGSAGWAGDPVDAPYDWNGFYIGVTGGYGFGDYGLGSASGNGPGVDVDNFVFGGTAGFNFQPDPNWLIGLEADLSSGVDGKTGQGTAGPFWSCNTGACNVDIEYFGTVRARAGFTHDAILIYGTGGLAYGAHDGGIFNSAQQGSGDSFGWAAGGGVEYGFTPNLSVKVEYLHVDLGTLDFGTGAVATEEFNGKGDFDVLRAGLNWNF